MKHVVLMVILNCLVGAMIKNDEFASYSQFLQHFLLAERRYALELGITHQITRELIYIFCKLTIDKSLSLHLPGYLLVTAPTRSWTSLGQNDFRIYSTGLGMEPAARAGLLKLILVNI